VTHYRAAIIDGHKVFYPEAGAPEAPSLLLLHGFPTSSHMFPRSDPRWSWIDTMWSHRIC
jgi:pimeloyl-ACP methyl ester carboxylesterase